MGKRSKATTYDVPGQMVPGAFMRYGNEGRYYCIGGMSSSGELELDTYNMEGQLINKGQGYQYHIKSFIRAIQSGVVVFSPNHFGTIKEETPNAIKPIRKPIAPKPSKPKQGGLF